MADAKGLTVPPERVAEALERILFNDAGLVPAIAQDSVSGDVLMMAWMNEEAVRRTLETGQATYWSRSRQAMWRKGETSGHTQTVRSFRIDCDGDTILMVVDQVGPACHTGRPDCFFTDVRPDGLAVLTEPVV